MDAPESPLNRPLLALAVLGLHGLVGAAMWTATMPADAPDTPERRPLLVRLAAPVTASPPATALPLPVPAALRPPAADWLTPPEVTVASVPVPVPLPLPVPVPATASAALPALAAPSRQEAADTSVLRLSSAPQAARSAAPAAAPSADATTASPALARPQTADHRACARAPYPAALRERGIQGELMLRVHVAPDGHAAEVQLLASSGWRLFDEAALAQARGCRFRPAQADGRAVAQWVEFPVKFALDG